MSRSAGDNLYSCFYEQLQKHISFLLLPVFFIFAAEIDRVMKKVDEGAELFDEIWLKGKQIRSFVVWMMEWFRVGRSAADRNSRCSGVGLFESHLSIAKCPRAPLSCVLMRFVSIIFFSPNGRHPELKGKARGRSQEGD